MNELQILFNNLEKSIQTGNKQASLLTLEAIKRRVEIK